MKKFLLILVGLFVLSGCKDERPTIDVNTNQEESSSSTETNKNNESSDSVESSSEEEDEIVHAIEEMFQEELDLELIEITVMDDETTEAIPEPHKEYKVMPIDEDYQQSLLDSVYRIHNGTASPGERDIIRTIFENVKELASNLDNDNDAISFEFRNEDDEPILIAKSTRVEDFIQYDFDYQVDSESIEELESSTTEDPEENIEISSDTYIPQPTVPSDWQNSGNTNPASNYEEPAQPEQPTTEPGESTDNDTVE
ncbi:membrane lipoprotein lipid attachment site-containing protein [Aerococcaceae bacterium DSM 111020]|nr:membrane lipoprotein lipid attachment site-containing protein [Aerococcaceae bacterium DSM 111020]